MPPGGGEKINVAVRGGKVKGETKCRADRSVSTGGYTHYASAFKELTIVNPTKNKDARNKTIPPMKIQVAY